MARVQDDQAHAIEDVPMHPVDDDVGDPVVCHVAPPGEHVSPLQHLVGEPVLRLIQGGSAYDGLFAQMLA